MKEHTIQLSARERKQLRALTRRGSENARVIKRAQVLLKSHAGKTDQKIAEEVDVTVRTVERIRKRYRSGGVDRALHDAPRPGATPVLDPKQEAYLVALACSDPPKGRKHWTLELLQKRLVRDGTVRSISYGTIYLRLRERGLKPWREKNVVHSEG